MPMLKKSRYFQISVFSWIRTYRSTTKSSPLSISTTSISLIRICSAIPYRSLKPTMSSMLMLCLDWDSILPRTWTRSNGEKFGCSKTVASKSGTRTLLIWCPSALMWIGVNARFPGSSKIERILKNLALSSNKIITILRMPTRTWLVNSPSVMFGASQSNPLK